MQKSEQNEPNQKEVFNAHQENGKESLGLGLRDQVAGLKKQLRREAGCVSEIAQRVAGLKELQDVNRENQNRAPETFEHSRIRPRSLEPEVLKGNILGLNQTAIDAWTTAEQFKGLAEEITKQIGELDLGELRDLRQAYALLADLFLAVKKAQQHLNRAEKTVKSANTLGELYPDAVLKSAGFETEGELQRKIFEITDKIWDLRRQMFGRLRNKNAIRVLEAEESRLKQIKVQLRQETIALPGFGASRVYGQLESIINMAIVDMVEHLRLLYERRLEELKPSGSVGESFDETFVKGLKRENSNSYDSLLIASRYAPYGRNYLQRYMLNRHQAKIMSQMSPLEEAVCRIKRSGLHPQKLTEQESMNQCAVWLDLQEWETFKNTPQVKEKLGAEDIKAFEELVGRTAAEFTEQAGTSHAVENIYSFPSGETWPKALLYYRFNSFGGYGRRLAGFVNQLAESQTEEIKHHQSRSETALLKLIRAHPDFWENRIGNPEYRDFLERLKTDPEFLAAIGEKFYPERDIQAMAITEGSSVDYDLNTQTVQIPAKTFPDLQLQPGKLIHKGTPEYEEVLLALRKNLVDNLTSFFGSEEDEIDITVYGGETGSVVRMPTKQLDYFLNKYGKPADLQGQEIIDNPAYKEAQQQLGALAKEQFIRGGEVMQKLCLDIIARLPPEEDLSSVVGEVRQSLQNGASESWLRNVIQCAVHRGNQADKQLAACLLNYVADPNLPHNYSNQRIFNEVSSKAKELFTCYAFGAELTEREINNFLRASGEDIEPLDLQGAKKWLGDYRQANPGLRYFSGHLNSYVELAKIPDSVGLLKKLSAYGYAALNEAEWPYLKQIAENEASIFNELELLRSVSPKTLWLDSLSNLDKCRQMAAQPEWLETLRILSAYGYVYSHVHFNRLEEMTSQKDRLVRETEEIKTLNPNFTYAVLNQDGGIEPYERFLRDTNYNTATLKKIQGRLNLAEFKPENWAKLLVLYVAKEDIIFLPENWQKFLDEAFSQQETKNTDLVLAKLRESYTNFLNSSPNKLSPEVIFLLGIIDRAGGAGHLKHVERLGEFMWLLRQQLLTMKASLVLKEGLVGGLRTMEQRFTKERWSDEERSAFYGVSKEILTATPTLYEAFLRVFEQLSAKELKGFTQELLNLYQARLMILQNVERKNDSRGLLKLQQDLENLITGLAGATDTERPQFLVQAKTANLEVLKSGFKQRFGLLKIPEKWEGETMRYLQNFATYLGNINGRNQGRENLIVFYLGLNLNNEWQLFRQHQPIDVTKYFEGEKLKFIQEYLKAREGLNILTTEALGIKPEEVKDFQDLLQEETAYYSLGQVETIDVKLGNLNRNLMELGDEDAYPNRKDKLALRLCKKEGKKVNEVLAKTFQKLNRKEASLSVAEQSVLMEIQGIFGVIEWNKAEAKRVQDEVRAISLVANMLEIFKTQNVEGEIQKLQSRLTPSQQIIEIFNRLGEEFEPQSGALALSQDLEYLENIIVKNRHKLTPEDNQVLDTYLNSIREQMSVLEKIYDVSRQQLIKIGQSIHPQRNELLHTRVEELKKIVHASSEVKEILSRVTSDFNLIIENMRQCLGCTKKEANNDTNLTFGDSNKFYCLSSRPGVKGSLADEVVFLAPVEYEGKKSLSFVMDQVYGNKSADVLFAHVGALAKKIKQLRTRSSAAKISVVISQAALASSGLDTQLFIDRLGGLEIKPAKVRALEKVKVNIPASASGDHYVEIGDGQAREIKIREIKGILLEM